MAASKWVYLLLFGWIEVSSEWELSVPSVDVPALLRTGCAWTVRGIPAHSCFPLLEWCVKCVGFFACGCFSLSPLSATLSLLFFSRHSWVDGQWGGVKVGDGSGGGSLGSERACRPLPLQPSSLTSCGIEEEYGFNREREVLFLKRGGGARGCLG